LNPRTDPPTGPFGDEFGRFSARLDDRAAECHACESLRLDVWITEGGTAARTVCVDCGHEHDDEATRALYDE
jgi:Zn ribbon nucleic-acid-binding protein